MPKNRESSAMGSPAPIIHGSNPARAFHPGRILGFGGRVRGEDFVI